MPNSSSAVDSAIGPYEEERTTHNALAFATGLRETSNLFFDNARPEGASAHPMMVMPLERPISRDLRGMPSLGVTDEKLCRAIHAEQNTMILASTKSGAHVISQEPLLAKKYIKPEALTVSQFVERALKTPFRGIWLLASQFLPITIARVSLRRSFNSPPSLGD